MDWYYSYLNLIPIFYAFKARSYFIRSLGHRVTKMWLMRGGKIVRVERTKWSGDAINQWAEIRYFNPITEDLKDFEDKDNADYLDKEG